MSQQQTGTLALHENGSGRRGSGQRGAARPRTIIVSGVARSGTSMVARLLSAAGVFLGDEIDDVVFEDHAFARTFEHVGYDRAKLDALIAERNADHPVWGFKRPHLHVHGAGTIERFRNPLVILTLRDPVAIAERNAIAEVKDAALGVAAAMRDLQDVMRYAKALACPTLLVSYEQALARPEKFISTLLDFCDLEVSRETRQTMRHFVEPGRPAYVASARRVFEGYIDEINGTILSGWAWQKGVIAPMPITVMRDGVDVSDHIAALLRPDLASSGIGAGYHAFLIDLAGQGFGPDSRVGVRITGRNFTLTNSGATVSQLGGDPDRLDGS